MSYVIEKTWDGWYIIVKYSFFGLIREEVINPNTGRPLKTDNLNKAMHWMYNL